MNAIDAYRRLEAQEKRMAAISGALAMLGWDRAVMMPEGGAAARAEQMAGLGLVLHEMQTDPARADLIADAQAGGGSLDPWQRANLHEIARAFARATVKPADLVENLSHARAATEMAWRRARADNDFAAVAPLLANLLSLVREEAAVVGEALGLDPYDALLDGYDPGLRTHHFVPVFARLAEAIPPLLDTVIERQAAAGAPLPLAGPFELAKQEKMGRDIMQRLGFDFHHGRLDVSHHPFTGGVPDDSRITTRYSDGEFIQSLMAVIHETGHSLYERGLPAQWRGQPVGDARGMTMHESQSLLFEMQAGRSPAYVAYLARLARDAFGGHGPAWDAANLLKHYHKVDRGVIRVYADEISYPLHVILRTGLERDMIAGKLAVDDLPQAWRAGMVELLGIEPESDRDGCLQDIHWYGGAFGYFPTYTLGALAAAQLFQAALARHPDIEAELARGRADSLLAFVRERVHSLASSTATGDILQAATGRPLGPEAFIAHLQQRYLGVETSALAPQAAAT